MARLWYPAAHTAGLRGARSIPALAGRSLDAQPTAALGSPVPTGTFHALWPYLPAFFTQDRGHFHEPRLDRPSPRDPEMLFEGDGRGPHA
jgi:hypothetical protein